MHAAEMAKAVLCLASGVEDGSRNEDMSMIGREDIMVSLVDAGPKAEVGKYAWTGVGCGAAGGSKSFSFKSL
jgi:hypothetical protein